MNGGYAKWIGAQFCNNYNDVAFVNPSKGFVVNGIQNEILLTKDQGAIWTTIDSVSKNPNNDIVEITFIDSINGWAVTNNWRTHKHIGSSTYSGEILATKDGGNTWLVQDQYNHDYEGIKAYSSIFFADNLTGWCAGGYYRSYLPFTAYLPLIINTKNGGLSWNIVPDSSISISNNADDCAWLYDICFPNKKFGYAIGDSGTIIASIDSGNTWIKQSSGVIDSLLAMSFIDSLTGYIVGSNGTILSTSNGGINWIKNNSNTTKNLKDIFFINKNYGWAVGDSGTILRTIDGGNRWSGNHLETDTTLNAVVFTDTSNGWVVSTDGKIFHITDGGGEIAINKLSLPSEHSATLRLYPNPVKSSLNIRYQIEVSGKVNISIYNLNGRKIHTVLDNFLRAGNHMIHWNGKLKSGANIAKGTYIIKSIIKEGKKIKTLSKKLNVI